MAVGIKGIGQIHISVADVDRAVEFYRDMLGLPFLFRVPGQPMAFFDCGGVRLMLGVPESPAVDHPSSVLYYRVEDLRAAHATLTGRGVRFENEPHLVARLPDHELWMAFFRDVDANLLALMSEVRPR